MNKIEAEEADQRNNLAKSAALLPPFMSRLFDYPSAFGIIAARGAVLVLVGRHDGVMTPRDGVVSDSTRTRGCTMIAAVGA